MLVVLLGARQPTNRGDLHALEPNLLMNADYGFLKLGCRMSKGGRGQDDGLTDSAIIIFNSPDWYLQNTEHVYC